MQTRSPIPYEQPGQRRRQVAFYKRLIGQFLFACLVFAVSVTLCAICGGLLGKIIATSYPSYYPSVFPTAATRPGFDPVQVGIGTGVGQGAAAGVFVGAVIVLALAVANRRRKATGRDVSPSSDTPGEG